MKSNWFVVAVAVLALWIHFAPQIVFWYEANERGEQNCGSYHLSYEWSWWSLRFYYVFPECDDVLYYTSNGKGL